MNKLRGSKGLGVLELLLILVAVIVFATVIFKTRSFAVNNHTGIAGITVVTTPNLYNLMKQEDIINEVEESAYNGPVLTKRMGVNNGPSGKETYYNLPMNHCIYYMKELGYDYDYRVRYDGVKMYGDYVMIAADTRVRPKGTVLQTSLGAGMVCDHCEASEVCYGQIDIAVVW